MKRFPFFRILIGISLLIFLFMTPIWLSPTLAIGPGTGGSKIRVNDEQIGPYTLLVATAPLPVTVGQMSVWVRVTENQTEELRRDALVMVEAIPRDGGPMRTAQGTHQNAGNNFDYVAHIEAETPGQWDITVYVEDEPGAIDVSFTETVTRGSNFRVLVGLAIPFIIILFVVGVYLWRRPSTT